MRSAFVQPTPRRGRHLAWNMRSAAPRFAASCAIRLDRLDAVRPLSPSSSLPPAPCASASRPGLPSRRCHDLGEKDVTEIEDAVARSGAALSIAFRMAREARAASRVLATPAIFHSVMLADIRSKTTDLYQPRPGGLCGRMEVGRHPRASFPADGGNAQVSIRAPATTSPMPFPILLDFMSFEGTLDGELLVGGPQRRHNYRDRRFRRPAATPQPQDRLGKACLTIHPAFVRLYDLLFDGKEDMRGHISFADRRDPPPRFFDQTAGADALRPFAAGCLSTTSRTSSNCARTRRDPIIEGRDAEAALDRHLCPRQAT